jgi:hypothetical protein
MVRKTFSAIDRSVRIRHEGNLSLSTAVRTDRFVYFLGNSETFTIFGFSFFLVARKTLSAINWSVRIGLERYLSLGATVRTHYFVHFLCGYTISLAFGVSLIQIFLPRIRFVSSQII